MKLLPQGSYSPIYILGEFHIIWRSLYSRMSCLGFQIFRRAQLPWKIQHLERLALDVGIETLGGRSYFLDLSSVRVWAHLETSSIRAELWRVPAFSWSVALFNWKVCYSDLLVLISHPAFGGYFVSAEHFVAAHIYCLSGHLRIVPDWLSIVLIPYCS